MISWRSPPSSSTYVPSQSDVLHYDNHFESHHRIPPLPLRSTSSTLRCAKRKKPKPPWSLLFHSIIPTQKPSSATYTLGTICNPTLHIYLSVHSPTDNDNTKYPFLTIIPKQEKDDGFETADEDGGRYDRFEHESGYSMLNSEVIQEEGSSFMEDSTMTDSTTSKYNTAAELNSLKAAYPTHHKYIQRLHDRGYRVEQIAENLQDLAELATPQVS